MQQRPMRTLLCTMFLVMAVGMAACSGVRRGPAARPSQRMHADAALEERLPGGVRLAAASAVATTDAPTPIPPLDDEEVIEEYDPWEPFNRRVFAFNRQLDRFALKPVATVWDAVLPDLAQESLGNFFDNLRMPARLVNHLFQRDLEGAGREVARFSLNVSMGVLGFFDAATELGLATREADTGQTLGIYGVGPGPYLVLPLLPPLTVRDGMGFAVDSALNPLNYVAPLAANAGSRGTNIVNDRALNLERFEGVEEATLDLYTAVRNAYLQRRQRVIQEGCASPRRRCRVSQAVTRLARLTPGSRRRHRAAKGGGLAGSAHELPAACTVDRRRGGRTQDEAAVDQAFSAALPDVQDRGATWERGSGARLWHLVRRMPRRWWPVARRR